MSRILWILQLLLAVVFLCSGALKLLAPIERIQEQLPLPELYVRTIGVVETLGALGLVLPALLRIRPVLTPLAAGGLMMLMAGATLLTPTLTGGQVAPAALPLTLAVLNGIVVYGRARRAPISPREVGSTQAPLAYTNTSSRRSA